MGLDGRWGSRKNKTGRLRQDVWGRGVWGDTSEPSVNISLPDGNTRWGTNYRGVSFSANRRTPRPHGLQHRGTMGGPQPRQLLVEQEQRVLTKAYLPSSTATACQEHMPLIRAREQWRVDLEKQMEAHCPSPSPQTPQLDRAKQSSRGTAQRQEEG